MAASGDDLDTDSQGYFFPSGSSHDNLNDEKVDSLSGNALRSQEANVSTLGTDDVEQVEEGLTELEIDKDREEKLWERNFDEKFEALKERIRALKGNIMGEINEEKRKN